MLASLLAILSVVAGSPATPRPLHAGCTEDPAWLISELAEDFVPLELAGPEAPPLGEGVICRGDRADPPDCQLRDPMGTPRPLGFTIPGSVSVLPTVLPAPSQLALTRLVGAHERARALSPGHPRGIDRPPRALSSSI